METIWYFAFGSNLKPSRMRRRRVRELRSEPVVLPGWELSMELEGIPFLEPGFATLLPSPHCEVHGVAIELERRHYHRLLRSELTAPGHEGRGYRPTAVQTHPYAGGARLEAMALIGDERSLRPESVGSERYMRLLREGARERGLEREYQEFLDHLPRFHSSFSGRILARAGMLLASPLLAPLELLARLGHPDPFHTVLGPPLAAAHRHWARSPSWLAGRIERPEEMTEAALSERWPRFRQSNRQEEE